MPSTPKIISTIPFILFSIAIFIASSIEGPQLPDLGFQLSDKLLHITIFFLYGITVIFLIVNIFPHFPLQKQYIYILVIGAIYALSDEIHQNFVAGRDCNIFDFLADLIGITLSLLLTKKIKSISLKLYK